MRRSGASGEGAGGPAQPGHPKGEAKKEPVGSPALIAKCWRPNGAPACALEEGKTSQTGMPLLTHLVFDRKAGCRQRRMSRPCFMSLRIYGANQMIDCCLFPYVPPSR